MSLPKNRKELEDLIVNIWRSSIDSLFRLLKITGDRTTIIEENITIIESNVEENTEEILATKAEVQEVKYLLGLLVFELIEQGVKIESQELQQLINELDLA